MRLKEFNMIVETVAETQDILKLSRDIMDYIYMNRDRFVAGTQLVPSSIESIKATTPAGQTVLNATRIKIVDPKVFKSATVGADAAPYYTDSQGNYGSRAYNDARMSREVNQGKWPGIDVEKDPAFKDLVSDAASKGNRLDIRMPVEMIADLDRAPGALDHYTSVLSHELTHHLDTIKGRNTVDIYDKTSQAEQAQHYLDKHEEAKKLITPENPNPPGLLSPKDEKRMIGIVKTAPKSLPTGGNRAYFIEPTEINARLTQAAGDLAKYAENWKFYNNNNVKVTIEAFLDSHRITNCFLKFANEAEWTESLTHQLTAEQLREAYANPEFQKIYNRIFKFIQAEIAPTGIIAQAQKDGFKNWNKATQALGGQTPKATFIERFIQQVVKGAEAVKDVAKLALRHIADSELKQVLAKQLPKMLAKGVLKSIPYVGALIGIVFGIDRLIKGDVPGAGLEVVGGVGSLATAIPATAYQAARDLYGEYYVYADSGKPAVFEYDMANDPEGTQQRVSELAEKIEQELKEGLSQNQSRLTGKQAAANRRSAIRNMDTPGNPSPALHPELYPQNESLARIIELSAVKKPT
jgi:hypothetical protein